MDQPPLGHKAPKPGYARLSFCPACRDDLRAPAPLTSRHVLEDCVGVSPVRRAEGISKFLDDCLKEGRSRASAYMFYVTGKDCNGEQIPVKDHLERGGSLSRLTDAWLGLWYEEAV